MFPTSVITPNSANTAAIFSGVAFVSSISSGPAKAMTTSARSAAVAASTEHFGRGHGEFVHLAPEEIRTWHPSEHGADIRPTGANLVPEQRRTAHPPEAVLDRPVLTSPGSAVTKLKRIITDRQALDQA